MPVLGYDPPQLYLAQLQGRSLRAGWPWGGFQVSWGCGVALRFPLVVFFLSARTLEGLRTWLFSSMTSMAEVIGVLWKPTSFQPQPFKVSWLVTVVRS